MSASIINVEQPVSAAATARFEITVVFPSLGSELLTAKQSRSPPENAIVVLSVLKASLSMLSGAVCT